MTNLGILPPIPRPPHDPTSLTLDASRGWHASALNAVLVDPESGALTLAVASGPPALAAVSKVGDVWLLDATACTLNKLDVCGCVFVEVPHVGGKGNGARQFDDPQGLTA